MIKSVTGIVETRNEVVLRDLAVTIRREADLALQAGQSMVLHAVACGEALLAAKEIVPCGQWMAWCEENLPTGYSRATCGNYMRLAGLKEHVDPACSITTNLQLVAGLEAPGYNKGVPRFPPEIKQEALRLHATGEFTQIAIAQAVGTTKHTIRAWTNPGYVRKPSKRRSRRSVLDDEVLGALDAIDRAQKYGEPGRPAIGQAVRRLAQVQNRDATREALLDLAAICAAWAERLT